MTPEEMRDAVAAGIAKAEEDAWMREARAFKRQREMPMPKDEFWGLVIALTFVLLVFWLPEVLT